MTKSPRRQAPVVVSRSAGNGPSRTHEAQKEARELEGARKKAHPSESGNGKKVGHHKNATHANSPAAQKKAHPSQSGNGKKVGHHENAAHSNSANAQKHTSQAQGEKKGGDKQGNKSKEEHCDSPGKGKGQGNKSVCHSPAAVASRVH